MAKRSKVHPSFKTRYRLTNWSEYDRALASRGSLTVWFSPDAIKAWTPRGTARRGGQRRYSNVAVQTALYLRLLFRLPWRQAEGLLNSLVRLLGLRLEVPDSLPGGLAIFGARFGRYPFDPSIVFALLDAT